MRNGVKELPKPKTYEGMSQYRPPLCFELAGKRFELVMDDGYEYLLSFKDRKTLEYGVLGGSTASYEYDCLKADDDTYLVNFEYTGSSPRAGIAFILDMEQSLVTENYCTVGENPRYPQMPKPKIIFGAIRKEDGTVPHIRHGYTEDLVGRSIKWSYGTFAVVHVYSSERYYRLTIPDEAFERLKKENPERYEELRKRNGETLYEEPGDYIKIKDGIYAFNANEEMACREGRFGSNLFFLMNLDRMHDVGRAFGHNDDGVPENYTYGAFGEYYDTTELHQRKSTEYIR